MPDALPSGEIKISSQPFDENVTIPAAAALILAGTLARKDLAPGEDDLYKNNILKALLDPSFKSGDSEFILLIHPSHSGEEVE